MRDTTAASELMSKLFITKAIGGTLLDDIVGQGKACFKSSQVAQACHSATHYAMAGSLDGDQLSISLEDHLVDTLRPLHSQLPDHLAQELTPYLSTSPPPAIPYSLLFSISRWTRSDSGLEALHTQTPPLNPQSYSMVSLLAGAATSPERFFGSYTPPKDPAEVQAEKKRERKAITALLNALLSIVGSAFATWWAAEMLGWRNEWVCCQMFYAADSLNVCRRFQESFVRSFCRDTCRSYRGCLVSPLAIAR